MSECCSPAVCLLTDPFGNPISPYAPNAIMYAAPLNHGGNNWSVAIESYVAVFSEGERISPPIPFCIITPFRLSGSKESSLTFQLKSFHSWAIVDPCRCTSEMEQIKLLISIETFASSRKGTNLLVPKVDSDLHIVDRVCIYADRICDFVQIHSETCIFCRNAAMRAEISQYCTIADGIKRTFRNDDELKEYGCCGILSPEEVTYYNVFVNGVLQPKKNYILKKGELTFITQDVPSKGQTVMILFVTWEDLNCQVADAVQWQFSAISDGFQKIYKNEDELPEYKSCGIPSPTEVSFFNLYVNGVLQPQVNYCVQKGVLSLTTRDAPSKGALVILESVIIRNSEGQLFQMENTSYNAYSNGGKIYTDRNGIRAYGTDGIPDPEGNSYQNLFINSVLQPHVNYFVKKGYVILKTEDNPTVTAPLTLQSINNCRPIVQGCETQMSETALSRWKKEYSHFDEFVQSLQGSHSE